MEAVRERDTEEVAPRSTEVLRHMSLAKNNARSEWYAMVCRSTPQVPSARAAARLEGAEQSNYELCVFVSLWLRFSVFSAPLWQVLFSVSVYTSAGSAATQSQPRATQTSNQP